jgi:hypothetical protein
MKKLLFVLAIGAIAASCTDTTTDAEATTDSAAVVTPDTAVMAPATPDTTVMVDTTAKKMDTAVVK